MTIFTLAADTNEGLSTEVHATERAACESLYERLTRAKYECDTVALKAHLDANEFGEFCDLAAGEMEGEDYYYTIESHELALSPALVTIVKGVGCVTENPGELPVLILDFDNLEADLNNAESGESHNLGALSTEEIAYLEKNEPDLYERLHPFLPETCRAEGCNNLINTG